MMSIFTIRRWSMRFPAFGESQKTVVQTVLTSFVLPGQIPDPVKAVKSALFELAGMMHAMTKNWHGTSPK